MTISTPKGNLHRFLLFLSLLVVIGPFLRADTVGRVIINVILGAVLASGALLFVRRRRVKAVGIVLAVGALVSSTWEVVAPAPGLAIARQVFLVLFLVFTAAVLLNVVLAAGKVTSEKLSGAVCIFLLLGFIWSGLFSIVEMVTPGSVQVPDHDRGTLAEVLQHGEPNSPMVYFSFVTLTTLGYGDVLPVSPMARMLAWLEAVVGQLYLTILVARLVGLHLAYNADVRGS